VVERGFASDTTGKHNKNNTASRRDARGQNPQLWHPSGMQFFYGLFPVVSLAKPRSTTGYNLASLRLAPLRLAKFIS